MKIVGFGLRKIFGERKEVKAAELNLTQNIEIKEISKEKVNVSTEEVINIKFAFTVNYSGDLGKIEFEGSVIILPDKDEAKDLSKSVKEQILADKFKAPIFNFIMTKCNVKALMLEDDINLPFHISMPRLPPPPKKD